MIANLKLPLAFDPVRLQAELALIRPEEWIAHFNVSDYEGEWSGVALRAVGGRAAQIYPDPSPQAVYADTKVLARCAYYREVLAAFACPLTAVRLLRLKADSSIREHRDHALGFEDGEVRLHVPIITNDDVAFFVDGARVPLRPGECWYLNVNLPHRVENRSAIDRIHLVLDCKVNAWLAAFFPADTAAAGPPDDRYDPAALAPEGLAQFRALALADPALLAELRVASDRRAFAARAAALGAARGCAFSADDVERALRAARRAWARR